MPGGRPPSIDINDEEIKKQVEIFGRLLSTQREMADWFGVHINTIERYMMDEEGEFFRIYKRAASEAKTSLRRMQMNAAEEGNATMLVWLGKQNLGQKDTQYLGNDKEQPLSRQMTDEELDARIAALTANGKEG